MIWEIGNTIKHMLLPPIGLGWLLGIAWWQSNRRPQFSRLLIALVTLVGLCLSLPVISNALLRLVTVKGDAASYSRGQAIVILGAARSLLWDDAHEKVLDANPGAFTLQRLRIGVRLAKQTGLPILVSGGSDGYEPTLAGLMHRVVTEDFGAQVRWIEDKSRNTAENADFSARILLPQKIRTVILVTSGFHMRRAITLFEKAGFAVLPAPVPPVSAPEPVGWRDFLPNAQSLMNSHYAFHELGGLLYSLLREKSIPSTNVGG